jgi:hypothetical protein
MLNIPECTVVDPSKLMPHRQSQYLFDHCPKCGCSTGSVYLRRWKKPGVYLRVEDIRGITVNERRHFDGLPPLNTEELAELDELNQEVIHNLKMIGNHWVAIVSILPLLLRKHSDVFEPVELREMFRGRADFMESINDDNRGKIDWGRWFNIANAYEKYGSYRAASRKTGFQSWDKVWHQVSPKYIKQKLPEVIKFKKEFEEAKYSEVKFLLNVGLVLRNDPELKELYNEAYERAQQRTFEHADKRSDVHQYYIIRHRKRKERMWSVQRGTNTRTN